MVGQDNEVYLLEVLQQDLLLEKLTYLLMVTQVILEIYQLVEDNLLEVAGVSSSSLSCSTICSNP